MSQPTSIQMLDAAIWKELAAEEVAESEAFYDALATLLSRWLLARTSWIRSTRISAYVLPPGSTRTSTVRLAPTRILRKGFRLLHE